MIACKDMVVNLVVNRLQGATAKMGWTPILKCCALVAVALAVAVAIPFLNVPAMVMAAIEAVVIYACFAAVMQLQTLEAQKRARNTASAHRQALSRCALTVAFLSIGCLVTFTVLCRGVHITEVTSAHSQPALLTQHLHWAKRMLHAPGLYSLE